MARKHHRTRAPWGYPADMSRPWRPGDAVAFAAACSCGWRRHGMVSMEEAREATDTHAEESGHNPIARNV